MLSCDFSADIVCISEPYTAVTVLVAMWVRVGDDGKPIGPNEAEIARLGVRIGDMHSDNILEVSTKGMSQQCLEGLCAYFIRSCEDDKLTCRYVVTVAQQPNLDFKFVPREFYIAAKSADALRAAEAHIKIGLPTVQSTITVAELQEESPKEVLRRFSAWHVP